jgi:hypothetical protein
MRTELARAAALAAMLVAGTTASASSEANQFGRVRLDLAGRYDGGIFSHQAVQNPPAWDAGRKRLYVGSQIRARVDVLDLSIPATPTLVDTIEISDLPEGIPLSKIGGGISSLAFRDGMLAVALAAVDKGDTGIVVLFDNSGRAISGPIDVGHSPNAMAFVPNRPILLVVNQADPGPNVDPRASLSVIHVDPDLQTGSPPEVSIITFTKFDGNEAALRAAGVRLITPGASASQELEPESLALSGDGRTAWITLPRNNAIGVVELEALEVEALLPLGTKDFSKIANGLDASDMDDTIRIRPWPVRALYEPDGIAAYRSFGKTFLVTANEGDPRPGEEIRVGEAILDLQAFPNAAWLQRPENLGRLQVTRVESDPDEDGDLDRLVALGARSLAVWSTDGRLVGETGSLFERVTARTVPSGFNATYDETEFDSRSDDRGPEPESIAMGRVEQRQIAFVAFEQVGGVIAVDVTLPFAPIFQDYVSTRNYDIDPAVVCVDNAPKSAGCAAAGDLGPESVLFIPAEESPIEAPLLIVRQDLSDTLTIFAVDVGEP